MTKEVFTFIENFNYQSKLYSYKSLDTKIQNSLIYHMFVSIF